MTPAMAGAPSPHGSQGRTWKSWMSASGLVSMHSPFEVSSKVDLWHLRRGFAAFFGS